MLWPTITIGRNRSTSCSPTRMMRTSSEPRRSSWWPDKGISSLHVETPRKQARSTSSAIPHEKPLSFSFLSLFLSLSLSLSLSLVLSLCLSLYTERRMQSYFIYVAPLVDLVDPAQRDEAMLDKRRNTSTSYFLYWKSIRQCAN
jgi:hypothetical protein